MALGFQPMSFMNRIDLSIINRRCLMKPDLLLFIKNDS